MLSELRTVCDVIVPRSRATPREYPPKNSARSINDDGELNVAETEMAHTRFVTVSKGTVILVDAVTLAPEILPVVPSNTIDAGPDTGNCK